MGSSALLLRRHVDRLGALRDPLAVTHRLVADDVLADRGLDLPGVAPAIWPAVLEPEDARGIRWRHVLNVRVRNRLDARRELTVRDIHHRGAFSDISPRRRLMQKG
jgi:hypothetical protein